MLAAELSLLQSVIGAGPAADPTAAGTNIAASVAATAIDLLAVLTVAKPNRAPFGVAPPERAGCYRSASALGKQIEPVFNRFAPDPQRHALALELGRRVAVDLRAGAHLEPVPERAGVVHPL